MYFHRVDDSQETDVLFILFIIFKYPSIHPVQAHGMLEPISADTGRETGHALDWMQSYGSTGTAHKNRQISMYLEFEVKVPRRNPCRHWENLQTLQ